MKNTLFILTTFFFNITAALAQKAVEGTVNDSKILRQLSQEAVKNPVYLKGDLEAWVNANNEFVVYAETKEKIHVCIADG